MCGHQNFQSRIIITPLLSNAMHLKLPLGRVKKGGFRLTMKLLDHIIYIWINIYPTNARKVGNQHCGKSSIKIYEPTYHEEVIINNNYCDAQCCYYWSYPASGGIEDAAEIYDSKNTLISVV